MTTKTSAEPKPKPYPFNYCAVIRKEFDEEEGARYRRVHDGYEVLFCCTPCVKAFETSPEPFMIAIRDHYQQLEQPLPHASAAAIGKRKTD